MQTMGVYWIEETEDFLESIGHLATPEDEARFDTGAIWRADVIFPQTLQYLLWCRA